MRVLQLHHEHAGPGGAMDVLVHERALLEAAGHEVDQYTMPPAEQSGLPAWRAGAKAVWNIEASRDVTKRVRDFQPDVVHAHTPFPLMSPAVFRAAKGEGVPTLATLHSFRYVCVEATCFRDGHICEDCVGRTVKWPAVRHRCYHGNAAASGALALSLLVHRVAGTFDHSIDRYLALTGFARDLMVRDGFPADKVGVKANSVPEPATFPAEETTAGEPYLVFAARLVALKGVRTILEAWRRLPDPTLRLVVAGDGELADDVRRAADADPRIEFRGWLDQDSLTGLMAGAVATVVPSEWYEAGPPLTLIRSLSVGTPVIASDLENICADLVADEAGTTFRTADAVSLAEVVNRVWQGRREAGPLRERCRQSFERRYSPQVGLERLVAEYERLVDGPPRRGSTRADQ